MEPLRECLQKGSLRNLDSGEIPLFLVSAIWELSAEATHVSREHTFRFQTVCPKIFAALHQSNFFENLRQILVFSRALPLQRELYLLLCDVSCLSVAGLTPPPNVAVRIPG